MVTGGVSWAATPCCVSTLSELPPYLESIQLVRLPAPPPFQAHLLSGLQ